MQPRWADLDINQHVNNVKYIAWILEVIFFPMICTFSLLFNVSCIQTEISTYFSTCALFELFYSALKYSNKNNFFQFVFFIPL